MQDDLNDLLSGRQGEKIEEMSSAGQSVVAGGSEPSVPLVAESMPQSSAEQSEPVISLAERLKLNRMQEHEEFRKDLIDVIENDPRLKWKILLFGIGIVVLLIVFAYLVSRPGKENLTVNNGDIPETPAVTDTVPAAESDYKKMKAAQDVNDKLRVDSLAVIARMAAVYHLEQKADLPVSPAYAKLNEDNPVSEFLKEALVRYGNSASVLLDPKNPDYYYAYRSADGKSIEISARLENETGKYCQVGASPCIYKEVITEAKMMEMSADLESYK